MARMGAAGIKFNAALRAGKQSDVRRLAGKGAFGRLHPGVRRAGMLQFGNRRRRKSGIVAMKGGGTSDITISVPGMSQDGRTARARQIA